MTSINFSPIEIKEGVYGITFYRESTPLFIRMELLTKENETYWDRFADHSYRAATPNEWSIREFTDHVNYITYDDYNEYIGNGKSYGFTKEEFDSIVKRVKESKSCTKISIPEVIEATRLGSKHISTVYQTFEKKYINYITTDSDFSIKQAYKKTTKDYSTINYIKAYKDLLIVVGSNFTEQESYENRGIFRNPYWILKGEYGGLSMTLLGSCAHIAKNFFPHKIDMIVNPAASMQTIISKRLKHGDGTVRKGREDVTEVVVNLIGGYSELENTIRIDALSRIFLEEVGTSKPPSFFLPHQETDYSFQVCNVQ